MNLALRSAAVVLLAGSLVIADAAGADNRTERLFAVGKLWATIKYFHPALEESDPGAWDDALVTTIPRVEAAKSRDEFRQAVEGMLRPLDDTVTRVEENENTPEPPLRTFGFASVEVRGRTLVVTSGRIDGDVLATSDAVKRQLPNIDAIVFDLRPGAVHPWLWDPRLYLPISREPIRFPAHRFRVHVGNVPVVGAYGVPFFSGLMIRAAPIAAVAADATDKRVVFLVREAGQLPPLAAALQDAGHGYIVAEQPIDDRAMSRHAFAHHYRMSLGENLVAHVRTSEMLHADGTVGLVADRVVKGDAFQAALDVAAHGAPRVQRRRARPVYQVKIAERTYSEMVFPSEPVRLLAAFRIWAAFEWVYPYRPLIDRDWDEVLRESLPKLMSAGDAREYHLAIAEMVTNVGDSHAVVESQVLTEFWGDAAPALALRPIEGRAVVVAITDPSTAASGIDVGDIVLAVDAQQTDARLAAFAHYISASTPQALRRDAVNRLLRGPAGNRARILLLKADGRQTEVSLERRREFLPLASRPMTNVAARMLPGAIGYVDLRVLMPHQVDAVFDELKDTRAIIFDMRGYPNDTRLAIASKLTDRTTVTSEVQVPIAMEPEAATVQRSRVSQQLQPNGHPYRGETVMLIDDRAQSQSEATALMLRAVHGTLFVGTSTAGANGDGTNLAVPGGIRVGMSGTGVTMPDGGQLQRVGVTPDVEVSPTIAGIRAGRDEVLERAMQIILGGPK